MNLASRNSSLVWKLGRDDRLSNAALSPDGTLLIARASPCVPSYFNDHLVVQDVATGHVWTIGGDVPRCHWLGPPQWTPDDRHVLVTYAPPRGKTPYAGPDGTCTTTGDNSLVRVDVTHQAAEITGEVLPPRHSCTWDALSVAISGTYAIEACGSAQPRLDGPTNLVHLSPAMRRVQQWPVGRCTNGNNVAADTSHGVVVAAYVLCNARGQRLRNAINVLERLVGAHLRQITTARGGYTAWDDLSW